MSARYETIYQAVRRIPAGWVATYGQVARLAGLPGRARQVGYALAALEAGRDVPWHRVINAQGRISVRDSAERQRELLEAEGVAFDDRDRVSLERYRWRGGAAEDPWLPLV